MRRLRRGMRAFEAGHDRMRTSKAEMLVSEAMLDGVWG